MEAIYKLICDKLMKAHQLFNLHESNEKNIDYDIESIKEIEFITKSELYDIEARNSYEYSKDDVQFLFESIQKYAILNEIEKNKFLLKLKFFFIKNANPCVFQIITSAMNSIQCIEDFSRVFLSAVYIKPQLIDSYIQIPNIAISLMNQFPKETFPSLIIIFSKALKVFDTTLFGDIKKLMEVSQDPYFYGIAIHRFAELSTEKSHLQLIPPLEFLLIKNNYKYPLKTVALLFSNPSMSFFNAFKKIFSIINDQILVDPTIDDEDILNSLTFIQQFSIHVSQIPQLCKEINTNTISSILLNNPNTEIKIKSLSILSNLIHHQFFQSTNTISFCIQNVEKISVDLPFPLKKSILDIYTTLAEIICVSNIDLLVTNFFVDFIFDFFGSDDPIIISKTKHICMVIASKSPAFNEVLNNQISFQLMCNNEIFTDFFMPINQNDC